MATTRHKVFVSFHEADRKYRKLFAKHMGSDVVDKSVGDGDIDPELKVDTTRGKIRDEFIAPCDGDGRAGGPVHLAAQVRRLGDRF